MGVGYTTLMYDAATLETGFGDVAACRYDGIEVGLGKVRAVGPETVADWLDTYGLELYCVMGGWLETDEAARGIADAAGTVADLGADRLGLLPPQRHRNDDGTVEDRLALVTDAALGAGLTPVLHHHGGTHVEYPGEVERFLGAVDGLELLFDTAHWYPYGDANPEGDVTDAVDRFGDDIAYVHLKDVSPAAGFADNRDALSAPQPHLDNVINYFRAFTDLGEGVVDFEGVYAALCEAGYDGHYTVETENRTEKPLVHAKENVDYWRGVTGEA
jgi:inosose dehydratase